MKGESNGIARRTSDLRRRGMTFLEMAVATAILGLILGSIAVVFSAMTRGTADAESNLLAQSECERGLVAIVEDLQTTDSIGKDPNGVPYFSIQNRDAGTANAVVFRRVEGFSADAAEDMVTMVYGTPVQYYIDAQSNLVREQDGKVRVAANRVGDIRFSLTGSGRIGVELVTYTGRNGARVEARSSIQVTPRNALKL